MSHSSPVSVVSGRCPVVPLVVVLVVWAVWGWGVFALRAAPKKEEVIDPAAPVSFYKQVRPILQGQCNGCHQPAKAKGGYVMTDFTSMLKGGEEGAAIVPGQPEASYLMKEITPDAKGHAEMPQKAEPLHQVQRDMIARWIREGAVDDTPASARQQYDREHPPVYATAPLVASLDYSPDGRLIAVAGYHEVLLHQADGSGIAGRLVGLSERVQKVAFSPDGQRLAVAGGNPGRMGEIQVWNVAKQTLEVSASVTYDTLYGVSWSPDGKQLAFGGADNILRTIDSVTGKEILFNGSANDWVLDTVWSQDGSHIIAASRDMSAKLTEAPTQRFVDNITSITPGALRGGIHAIARHPQRDEILIGGADGLPQIYRIFRQTARKIGDNANLIRVFPAMEGRIFSVAYAPDGKSIACGSAYHGQGAVSLYQAEFDPTIPADLKKIMETTNGSAKDPKVVAWTTADVKLQHTLPMAHTGIYALRYSPDGQTLAAGGGDGRVRLIDVATGKVRREFVVAPLADAATLAGKGADTSDAMERASVEKPLAPETLAPGRAVAALEVSPQQIQLQKATDYTQLLVTAVLRDGTRADVTRMARLSTTGPQVQISPRGLVRPQEDGQARITIRLGDQQAQVPVVVTGTDQELKPDYIRDVNPVLSKLGCNMGACHGAQAGKNGFQLSLRGYDMDYDVTAFTEELWSRRANSAAPARSLMLLKASGAVPHEGGQLTVPGEQYYETIKAWISDGAKMQADTPRVTRIEVLPRNPVLETIGEKQQMRVLATYANGVTKDVTAEAFVESGNVEVVEMDKHGLASTLRRGEAPLLARYEGAYAATTLTVMGDRSEFTWSDPPKYNRIDQLVANKWQRMKIQPSDLCTDSEYLRRVYLDLTGLPPSAETVRAFLADPMESRLKRDRLVDRLLASDDFVEQWSNKWADMLQVNSKFLGEEGADIFRQWIRDQVAANRPYDQLVYDILTASGSNKDHPAASYYKILRTPEETMENTTHLFLATRFNCNKCHDHPFERWTQGQYYETAAYFAQIGFTRDPASGNQNIGGSAVEGAKPLYEIVQDMKEGEVLHQRTQQPVAPEFPYPVKYTGKPENTRREKLAAWMTSADNPYFAMSYANRIWGYLTGVGVIEPLDDIRAGNPPSNPELLSYLTEEFIGSQFDVRHLMRLICKSRTYQLSISTNRWNEDDKINYSHAQARRLPAESLYDAIFQVTGAMTSIPGVRPGTRAAALADAQTKLTDGFLNNFGRPVRESSCECERSNEVQLGPVMALVSGPTLGDAISQPGNAIARLAAEIPDDRKLVEELYLRILNRTPKAGEVEAILEVMQGMSAENKALLAEWSAYEVKSAPQIAQLEQERAARIQAAQQALATYQKESAPAKAKQEAERQERITKAEAASKAIADQAAERVTQWEPYLDLSTEWQPLELEVVKLKDVAKLEKQPDGSYLATALPAGPNAEAVYILRARTDLTGITGIKIEALPDERLPSNGPGLSTDGNFVLTEFSVNQNPVDKRSGAHKGALKLRQPKASFQQKDFTLAASINENRDVADRGWAVSPQTGRRHEAILETDPAVTGAAGGVQLTFTLQQGYQRQRYHLGRFRISVTTAAQPLRFGVSRAVAAILRTPADQRQPAQNTLLQTEYLLTAGDYQKAQQQVVRARLPLPVDAQLVALEGKVTTAQEPIVMDPKLLQLRRDAELSQQQYANLRLTAAQDLAWALINSPAFLFNH